MVVIEWIKRLMFLRTTVEKLQKKTQSEKDLFLLEAVSDFNTRLVKIALKAGANPLALQEPSVTELSTSSGFMGSMNVLIVFLHRHFLLKNVHRNSFFLSITRNVEILELFLDAGVDVNAKVLSEPSFNLNSGLDDSDLTFLKDRFDKTALQTAIEHWNPIETNFKVIEMLINRGADLSEGFYLDLAFRHRKIDVVTLLLEKGAELNVNAYNPDNKRFPFAYHFDYLNDQMVLCNFSDPLSQKFLRDLIALVKYLICTGGDKKIEQTPVSSYYTYLHKWPAGVSAEVFEKAKGTPCEGAIHELDLLYKSRSRNEILSQEINCDFGPVPSLMAQCLQRMIQFSLDALEKAGKKDGLKNLPMDLQEKVAILRKYTPRC